MEINQRNAKEKELNEHLVHESFRRYMVQKKTQVQLLFHKLSFNLRFSWGFPKLMWTLSMFIFKTVWRWRSLSHNDDYRIWNFKMDTNDMEWEHKSSETMGDVRINSRKCTRREINRKNNWSKRENNNRSLLGPIKCIKYKATSVLISIISQEHAKQSFSIAFHLIKLKI